MVVSEPWGIKKNTGGRRLIQKLRRRHHGEGWNLNHVMYVFLDISHVDLSLYVSLFQLHFEALHAAGSNPPEFTRNLVKSRRGLLWASILGIVSF